MITTNLAKILKYAAYAAKALCIMAVPALAAEPAHAQALDDENLGDIIYRAKLERIITYLSDSSMQGRATGSKGIMEAGRYITGEFKKYGLLPAGETYTDGFMAGTAIGRNIAGMIQSREGNDEYIIVTDHYDHIGILDGKTFPGADDNASGIAALLNIAEIFSAMDKAGKGPGKNIVFAALDAKELNMAGSAHFIKNSGIPADKIICNINIDQIGSVLAPPHADSNYVMVLGCESFRKTDLKKVLSLLNNKYGTYLDIDHSFYGSRTFYKIFYRLSDQDNFTKAGIPAILFTSGIHERTYKTSDTPDIISYPILKRRTELIFRLIQYLSENRP